MRKFIVYLLILTAFASNVAWAMDECFSQFVNEASVLTHAGDLSDDTQDIGACDEFCAGWLHLIGITPEIKSSYPMLTRQDVARKNLPYHSFNQQPPIRPPQI